MPSAVRGGRFGAASLGLLVLGFLALLFSAVTGIGFDPGSGTAVLVLYGVLPLVGAAVVLAVIGLFLDRKRRLSGIALIFVAISIGLGLLLDLVSRLPG